MKFLSIFLFMLSFYSFTKCHPLTGPNGFPECTESLVGSKRGRCDVCANHASNRSYDYAIRIDGCVVENSDFPDYPSKHMRVSNSWHPATEAWKKRQRERVTLGLPREEWRYDPINDDHEPEKNQLKNYLDEEYFKRGYCTMGTVIERAGSCYILKLSDNLYKIQKEGKKLFSFYDPSYPSLSFAQARLAAYEDNGSCTLGKAFYFKGNCSVVYDATDVYSKYKILVDGKWRGFDQDLGYVASSCRKLKQKIQKLESLNICKGDCAFPGDVNGQETNILQSEVFPIASQLTGNAWRCPELYD